MTTRPASHAGSWYTDDVSELGSQLKKWMENAEEAPPHAPARAIIAPHAGYGYSGPCAAYAYRQLDPTQIKRVFILGPSHHAYLAGCAVSPHARYATPFGDINVDAEVTDALVKTGKFEQMSAQVDEEEHSIEMHVPYIAYVMRGQEFTIVPILVGALDSTQEAAFGKLLRPFFSHPQNAFVVSSDFCHWGSRFRYQYLDGSCKHIHEGIEKLDRMAMDAIEHLSPAEFDKYLKDFSNTICGRHPIAVLLHAISPLKSKASLKFLHYAQSSKCTKKADSSVSYAAASMTLAPQ